MISSLLSHLSDFEFVGKIPCLSSFAASLEFFRKTNSNQAKKSGEAGGVSLVTLLASLALWAVAYGNIQTQAFVFAQAKKVTDIKAVRFCIFFQNPTA